MYDSRVEVIHTWSYLCCVLSDSPEMLYLGCVLHGHIWDFSLGGRNFVCPLGGIITWHHGGIMLSFNQQMCHICIYIYRYTFFNCCRVINTTIVWCRAATNSIFMRNFFCWWPNCEVGRTRPQPKYALMTVQKCFTHAVCCLIVQN